jgi:DNA polymerase bacteriophage-type
MTTVYLDLETRSTVDLRRSGVYPYAKHHTTEVLLASFAVGDGAVRTVIIKGQHRANYAFFTHTLTGADRIVAHNAAFERLVLRDCLGVNIPLGKWDCTAARARAMALPASLEQCAQALGLPVQKDREGAALMLRMCKPRKPRRGEDPKGVYWFEDDERMARLGAYCEQDVIVGRLLDRNLAPLTPGQLATWRQTEIMNDRGVPLDLQFIHRARWAVEEELDRLNGLLAVVTYGRVQKASNVHALRDWLATEFGIEIFVDDEQELDKRSVTKILAKPDLHPSARSALLIRQEAGKSSVAKLEAMLHRVDPDGRARGNLVYHGASTGRFAGTGIQLQNVVRETVDDPEAVKRDLSSLSSDEFRAAHGPALEAISKSLRSMVHDHNCQLRDTRLLWCDYSAVEARGVAWLAGASKLVNLFASDGLVYEEMAAKIFGIPVSKVEKFHRFIGKQTVLGCGYGMGGKKFVDGCDKFGVLVEPDLANLAVKTYREDNPEVPDLWKGLERAAIAAVENHKVSHSYRMITFKTVIAHGRRWLWMILPSGRVLWYANPRIVEVEGPYGTRGVLEYDAVNSLTKKWGPERTWGGKLTENAVQGLCADFITDATERLEARGARPILSVHDEIICEPQSICGLTVHEVQQIMCQLPEWAAGFPLKAEGKEGLRYGK